MKRKSRVFGRVLAMALCLVLCLAVLPANAFAATRISNLDIRFPAPVIGANPEYYIYSLDDGPYHIINVTQGNYKDGILWQNLTDGKSVGPTGVFEPGKIYSVTVFLEPDSGYEFDKLNMNVKVDGASRGIHLEEIEWNSKGITVTYEFPALPKLCSSGIFYIDAPVTGEYPSYDVTYSSSRGFHINASNTIRNIKGDVYWYNETDEASVTPGTAFQEGKNYRVTIYLTVDSDAYFSAPEEFSATVNGQKAKCHMVGTQMAVDYSFGPTDLLIRTITLEIEEPKVGEKPSYVLLTGRNKNYYQDSYSSGKMKYDVTWTAFSGDITLGTMTPDDDNSVFRGGNRYQLQLNVTPKDGYAFDFNNLTATINGREASVSRSARVAGQAHLACDFFVPVPEINEISLKIEEPRAGARPSYTPSFPENAPYYSQRYDVSTMKNDMLWRSETDGRALTPDEDCFEEGKKYTVKLYLTAQEGCYFSTGSLEATVNGRAAKVSISGGQAVVTYTFGAVPKRITTVSVEVPEPVAGEYARYKVTLPSGAHYKVGKPDNEAYKNIYAIMQAGMYWGTDGKYMVPGNGKFEEGKTYTACVIVEAEEGYAFDETNVIALMNGKPSSQSGIIDERYFVVQGRFEQLPAAPAGKWGDVDGSGVVDSDDAMLILRYDVKKIGKDKLKNFALADVDGSGVVDSDDAMLVLRFDVKKISKFPVEK